MDKNKNLLISKNKNLLIKNPIHPKRKPKIQNRFHRLWLEIL